jgi:hypothetical protein
MRWMSPELCHPEVFDLKQSRPTTESDCYALGMVILEVLSGRVPFAQDTDFIVIRKVSEGRCPERPLEGASFTDDLWKTLEKCWSFQPKDRPSVEAVLESLGHASVATATNSALQRLISRSFTEDELPSHLEKIFSSSESTLVVHSLQGSDVQTFVDVLDKARKSVLGF